MSSCEFNYQEWLIGPTGPTGPTGPHNYITGPTGSFPVVNSTIIDGGSAGTDFSPGSGLDCGGVL